ncbi:MAG: sulfite exporter TauE/SafE family protein, partial [Candidatus Limnocylindrus sp.]
MQTLIVVAIAGLVAQFVDGSLGMGYGLTSST